jgi:hypothetical protein
MCALSFLEKPDYQHIHSLFQDICTTQHLPGDDVFNFNLEILSPNASFPPSYNYAWVQQTSAG